MKTNRSVILLLGLAVGILTSACEKEEEPIALPPAGSAHHDAVTMGPDYDKIIYYDLGTHQTILKDLADWDLAFACGADEQHILINGGKELQLAHTGSTNFDDTFTIPSHDQWRWDNPNGHKDSTAIGIWAEQGQSLNHVYILDRGRTAPGGRFKKLVLLNVTDSLYRFRSSDLDGANEQLTIIPKDPTRNYVYYDFDGNEVIQDFEPPKDEWDIRFIRYRHVYYHLDPVTPYYVTGALINPNGVGVHKDSLVGFDHIDHAFAASTTYSEDADVIGWNWKYFDFDESTFFIHKHISYVVRDTDGVFFKLRFIDFYDNHGTKGQPTFEFQPL